MLLRSINVAIVDDHALFRKTLKGFLEEQDNINVVFDVSDAHELINELKTLSIEVLLVDIFLPGMNGAEAIKTIRSRHTGIRILALSMSHDLELISELLDYGIHGFISKADEPEELLQAIRAVSEGRIYKNRHLTEALYWNKQFRFRQDTGDAGSTLSDREKKVLQLLWEEKSNKEIADELFLGIRSVEKIRQDMKEKIGARSTVGMIKYALFKKIIGFDSRSADLLQ